MPTALETFNLAEFTGSEILTLSAHHFVPIAEEELADRIMQAFESPLDYPSLSQATVPGDRIAIAVHGGIPCIKQILAGTLEALVRAGVEEDHIAVIVPTHMKRMQGELQESLGDQVSVSVHDPGDSEQLALLGVTDAGEPLRLNRLLCDADLVISLGLASGSPSDPRQSERVFPTFTDQETLDRFQTPRNCESAKQLANLVQEREKCDWLIGQGLTLQVVPGPRGTIVECFCGTPAAAVSHSAKRFQEIWSHESSVRGDLVIASLGGELAGQNWNALGQALAAAAELVEPKGAIAICTKIAGPLGPSLRRLLDAADLSLLEKKLRRDHYPDSFLALQLSRVLQHHTVYLNSALDPRIVERLGMAPIANNEELRRLIQSHNDCVFLDHAQYLQITSA